MSCESITLESFVKESNLGMHCCLAPKPSLTVEREDMAVSKNSVEVLLGGGLGQLPKPE